MHFFPARGAFPGRLSLKDRWEAFRNMDHGIPLWAGSLVQALTRRLSSGERVLLAIDGGSASGKTTLAASLHAHFPDSRVFHMDDFFLRPEQRSEARYLEPGGNVDRERFLNEVLLPASRGEAVTFRRFDCKTFSLEPAVSVKYRPLTIVEGAYSLHPALRGYYGLRVFLKIAPDLQRKRIEERNTPAQQSMFFERWIPLEQRYFEHCSPEGCCDLVLEVET